MIDEIQLRKATLEDLPIITAIFKSAIEVMNNNNIPQWDEVYPNENTLRDDIIKGQMYVGERKSKIAAAFVLNQECDEQYENGTWEYPNCTYFVIHRLCVNPLFQNQKIGTITVLAIEKLLKADLVETIRLDAFSLNPYALRLYEKLGYKKVGEANYRKGLFYLYEKKI